MTDKVGEKLLYCSFCGKSQHEVRKLIAGPSVFICDECIDLCNDIIREEAQSDPNAKTSKNDLPTPQEICDILDQYVIDQIQAQPARHAPRNFVAPHRTQQLRADGASFGGLTLTSHVCHCRTLGFAFNRAGGVDERGAEHGRFAEAPRPGR